MNKFGVIFILISFSGYAKTQTPEATTVSSTATTFFNGSSTTTLSSDSKYTCSDKYRYSLPLIEFTKDLLFMFPLMLLLCEIFGLLILRGFLAFYVLRRRMKKIYIFTHPPILGEEYFADPPPYAVTKPN